MIYEPLLARWYGIRPWEIGLLSVDQFKRFVEEIKVELKARAKESRSG